MISVIRWKTPKQLSSTMRGQRINIKKLISRPKGKKKPIPTLCNTIVKTNPANPFVLSHEISPNPTRQSSQLHPFPCVQRDLDVFYRE